MDPSSERSGWNGGRTLVLGGTGLIGIHVVEAVRARGGRVRVLTRNDHPSSSLARASIDHLRALGAEVTQGHPAIEASLVAALEGCDRVVHAAAPYPKGRWHAAAQVRSAREGIAAFLSAIRPLWKTPRDGSPLRRVVFVSSVTTIGSPPKDRMGRPTRPANEGDRFDPTSERDTYFRMKWAMEEAVMAEAGGGAPIVVVNPALVIGAHDTALTTGRLLLPLARGLMRAYLPGVVPTVAARDVGEAIAEALSVGRIGARYILAHENLEARELMAIAAKEAGVPPPRVALPLPLAELIAHTFEAANLLLRREWPLVPLSGIRMARHATTLDASLARAELHLRGTPIVEALRAAFSWYRAQGLI